MTHPLEIIQVTCENVDLIAPLFDAYRRFYGQPPDLEGARQFLVERIQRDESVIFAAVEAENALGFTQLYPAFSSVSLKPIWILNDLFVVEEARRRGIGAHLLMAARNHALEFGAVRLVLSTAVENTTAQALYERTGWLKDTAFLHYKFELPRDTRSPTNDTATGCAVINVIVSDRIHLTEFRSTDKAACVKHLNDKEIHDLTLRLPHPYTEASFEEWFAIVQNTTKENGQPVHWAIRDDKDSWIGSIGFKDLRLGQSHRAEIGYLLAKPHWGKGIMTAVVRRACEYAFAEWGLVRITAEVFAFNPASTRVLEKCGFVQEGYLKKHHAKNGHLIDAKLYALVK